MSRVSVVAAVFGRSESSAGASVFAAAGAATALGLQQVYNVVFEAMSEHGKTNVISSNCSDIFFNKYKLRKIVYL